jgi:2-polyprenyl-3-methyl-5-hydroxy-6-metoxy-1,4-benzoquinol methylase
MTSSKPDSAPPVDAQARAALAALADAYDDTPYTSKPFPQACPERLHGLALLFGLAPVALAKARVLEIGCAAGGNLIPFACRQPSAQCVGIDLSERQIQDGLAQINAIGLTNCDLQVLDATQAAVQLAGGFDYIICHGVYTWVPPAVRVGMMRAMGQLLSPNGLAFVSYNVYPGWKLREVARDAMVMHAGKIESKTERVAQGKAILDFMHSAQTPDSAYGKVLEAERQFIGSVADYYLLHEFYESENHPLYFREFLAEAYGEGLGFLCESDLVSMSSIGLGRDIAQKLHHVSRGDVLAHEQYLDLITNRTFRQSVLVRQAQLPAIQRQFSNQALRRSLLTTGLSPELDDKGLPTQAFVDSFKRRVNPHVPVARALIEALIAARPAGLTFDAALNAARSADPGFDALALERMLGPMLHQGIVLLAWGEPPTTASNKPDCGRLIRQQLAAGQDWVTSHQHNAVSVDRSLDAPLLSLMDGSRDSSALARAVEGLFASGEISAQVDGAAVRDARRFPELAQDLLGRALVDFGQKALLL